MKVLIQHLVRWLIITGPKPWKFRLKETVIYRSAHLEGVEYRNDWITIAGGAITIQPGYAWDGCSPKWSILGLGYMGVPDGAMYLGVPATYYASLIHDTLCQWKGDIPITQRATVAVFDQLLHDAKFPLRTVYVWAVKNFGPQRFGGDPDL